MPIENIVIELLFVMQASFLESRKKKSALFEKYNYLTKIKQQMVQLLKSASRKMALVSFMQRWHNFPGSEMIYGANIRSRWKTAQQIILMRSAIKTVFKHFFMESLIQPPQQNSTR